ncbi:MAG: hypothetical protein LBC85_04810 [Fibromonadaceae bacterium]|nr:hypothetical protein [Fibromonadaceae bacterium]
MKLFSLIALLLAGCVSNTAKQPISLAEALDSVECKSGEFRGAGIGGSENEALSVARSALAKQVHSSVKVSDEYRLSRSVSGGKEDLSSESKSELVVEAALLNAHDARVQHTQRRANETGIVVCMSRTDAAKGFTERQRFITDSLKIVSAIVSTEHPKRKNEAWHKTQTLWYEFMRIQDLLEGWGVAKTDFFVSANEVYAKTENYYKNYCKNQKTYWEAPASECANIVFAGLFERIKITKEDAECQNGLRLRFSCNDRCRSSSFGVECLLEPSLAIESCNGAHYSLLKAKGPTTGNDMHSEIKAKENLMRNLPKASFFNEWEKEIREWVPQCVVQ